MLLGVVFRPIREGGACTRDGFQKCLRQKVFFYEVMLRPYLLGVPAPLLKGKCERDCKEKAVKEIW